MSYCTFDVQRDRFVTTSCFSFVDCFDVNFDQLGDAEIRFMARPRLESTAKKSRFVCRSSDSVTGEIIHCSHSEI